MSTNELQTWFAENAIPLLLIVTFLVILHAYSSRIVGAYRVDTDCR